MQELSSFESKNGFGQTALSSGFSLVWKICLTSVMVVPLASSNTTSFCLCICFESSSLTWLVLCWNIVSLRPPICKITKKTIKKITASSLQQSLSSVTKITSVERSNYTCRFTRIYHCAVLCQDCFFIMTWNLVYNSSWKVCGLMLHSPYSGNFSHYFPVPLSAVSAWNKEPSPASLWQLKKKKMGCLSCFKKISVDVLYQEKCLCLAYLHTRYASNHLSWSL